jgi:hypothetical protein
MVGERLPGWAVERGKNLVSWTVHSSADRREYEKGVVHLPAIGPLSPP